MIFPYFIPPFLAFVAAIFEKCMSYSTRKILYCMLSFCAVFIYCCVYLNGSDWPNYELFFENITWDNWIEESKMRGFELGFSFVLLWLKTIGFNFMISLILMKTFSLVVISNFFYYFSISKNAKGDSRNIFLLLFIFYTTSCMYLYVETIIRFSIALAIVVKSYKYFFLRKFVPFLILVGIAVLFHRTAIMVIPLYFIKEIKLSSFWIFLIGISVYIFFTPEIMLMFFGFIDIFLNNIFIDKLVAYMKLTIELKETNPFATGNIVQFIFFILLLFQRKKIESISQYGKLIFSITVIFFIVYFATIYMGPISRIRLFYSLFFILSLAVIFSTTYINRMFIFVIAVCFWISGMYLSIDNNFCFKHYTNYITAAIEGKADLTLDEKESIYRSWSVE